MPTNRKYRRRARQTGSRATPALISLLADPCDVALTVRLASRVGVPPLDNLDDEDEGDVQAGVEILRRLWLLHREAAVEYHVRRFGPGSRPTLWWEHDCPKPGRPYVAPRNWLDAYDSARYERERAAADVAFLKKHKLLPTAEKAALAEMRKKKHYGPESES
jgi:hypothetical protein